MGRSRRRRATGGLRCRQRPRRRPITLAPMGDHLRQRLVGLVLAWNPARRKWSALVPHGRTGRRRVPGGLRRRRRSSTRRLGIRWSASQDIADRLQRWVVPLAFIPDWRAEPVRVAGRCPQCRWPPGAVCVGRRRSTVAHVADTSRERLVPVGLAWRTPRASPEFRAGGCCRGRRTPGRVHREPGSGAVAHREDGCQQWLV